jgi:hypothetical protein
MDTISNLDDKHEKRDHPKTVRITLDGRTLTFDNETQTAAAVLLLGGLDPTGYDLAEVHHHQEPHVYADDAVLQLKNGREFVSIRQSAPVG